MSAAEIEEQGRNSLVCCSVLQCVTVCRSMYDACVLVAEVEEQGRNSQVCCGVLQCVAVRCSVLQCVAVHMSQMHVCRRQR